MDDWKNLYDSDSLKYLAEMERERARARARTVEQLVKEARAQKTLDDLERLKKAEEKLIEEQDQPQSSNERRTQMLQNLIQKISTYDASSIIDTLVKVVIYENLNLKENKKSFKKLIKDWISQPANVNPYWMKTIIMERNQSSDNTLEDTLINYIKGSTFKGYYVFLINYAQQKKQQQEQLENYEKNHYYKLE